MKWISTLTLAFFCLLPAEAEIIQVTVNGSVIHVFNPDDLFDSTIQSGTSITDTFTFDTNTPGRIPPFSGAKFYDDNAGISLLTVGDYVDVPPLGVTIGIYSGDAGIYGFALSASRYGGQSAVDEDLLNICFFSNNPALFPNTALSNVRNLPLGDFDNNFELLYGTGDGAASNILGSIDSYSVTVLSVPEPSSSALVLVCAGLYLVPRIRSFVQFRR